MLSNKSKVFAFTYKEEGGYGNDPNDPGGATNLGIIQEEYDRYRQRKSLPAQSVRFITREEADEIYTKSYWNKIDGDELPPGIDLVIYDYGVNSGPGRAIEYAQRILGVGVDGILGPITLAALQAADARTFIIKFDADRLAFLQRLKTYVYFGRGWSARVKRATNAALAMVGEPPKHTVPVPQQRGSRSMWLEVALGLARHLITGGGASAVGLTGFDLHNPMTWIGIASFLGGSAFSAIDKAQKSGHFDLVSVLLDTVANVNSKLEDASKPKDS